MQSKAFGCLDTIICSLSLLISVFRLLVLRFLHVESVIIRVFDFVIACSVGGDGVAAVIGGGGVFVDSVGNAGAFSGVGGGGGRGGWGGAEDLFNFE